MFSSKKVIRMARTWEKMAARGRRRVSFPRINKDVDSCNKSSMADKGHFVIYTIDQRRFMIPLLYLSSHIFRELFKMSEEEFGLPSDGPITLPCDSVFMNYIILLIGQGLAGDLEKALINSVTASCGSLATSSYPGHTGPRSLVSGC